MDIPFVIDESGGRVLVSLSGEIDLAWREQYAGELLGALETCSADRIVVDLSGVTFADSCATLLFRQIYKHSKDTDCELYFVSHPMFERVGLLRGNA